MSRLVNRYDFYDDGNTVESIYNGDLTTVNLFSEKYGVHARGHARRDLADIYDSNIGFHLAYYRGLNRLSRKIERHLRRQADAT